MIDQVFGVDVFYLVEPRSLAPFALLGLACKQIATPFARSTGEIYSFSPARLPLAIVSIAGAGRVDWSRSVINGNHTRGAAVGLTGPSPVDDARTGSRHHLITDSAGVPLATLGGVVATMSPNSEDRPRKRADLLLADYGYEFDKSPPRTRPRGGGAIVASASPSGLPRAEREGEASGSNYWLIQLSR